jgi:surface antigen
MNVSLRFALSGFVAFAAIAAGTTAAKAQLIDPVGQQALESARSGTIVQWNDPDGRSGSFVPQPAFQNAAGEICREFQQSVIIGGRQERAWGTACRQPDGSWRLQRPATVEAPLPPPRYVPAPTTVYVPVPPPPVVYSYRPTYFPPGYYYERPYYPRIVVQVGRGSRHHHHHHW